MGGGGLAHFHGASSIRKQAGDEREGDFRFLRGRRRSKCSTPHFHACGETWREKKSLPVPPPCAQHAAAGGRFSHAPLFFFASDKAKPVLELSLRLLSSLVSSPICIFPRRPVPFSPSSTAVGSADCLGGSKSSRARSSFVFQDSSLSLHPSFLRPLTALILLSITGS